MNLSPEQIDWVLERTAQLIAEGIELEISPERSGLSPEQVRTLVQAVMQAVNLLQGKTQ